MNELKKVMPEEELETNRLVEGSKSFKKQAFELQNKNENAGGKELEKQKATVAEIQWDIDKSSSDINSHKVQIETEQKNDEKKLTKRIEES
uniref:Uncharacterized protein n=1 Tax=Kalanchoe fedtschenkoi TaxID=63787 RepID=A0A7N0UZZ6_KALFE